MSLFGIVYVIAKAGSNLAVNIRNNAIDSYNKKHNVHLDGKTYIGHDGIPRIIGSGEKGTYSRNAAGDWVLYDEDHKEVYNFTRTENNSRDRERKKIYGEKGKTIYLGHNNWGEPCWRDVETNHKIKWTRVNESSYYWDVEDMCLLRLTDDEIKDRKKDPEYWEDKKYEDVDIPRFNRLLKEFKEKRTKDLSYCFPGQNVATTQHNIFLGTNSKESGEFYINYDPFIITSKYLGKYNIYIDKGDEDIVNEYWKNPSKVAENLIRKDWVPLWMREQR